MNKTNTVTNTATQTLPPPPPLKRAAGSQQSESALPQGVDSVSAIEPQNALLVRGTQQGIEKLKTIVAFLDRPMQQVEVEAQFVQVNRIDARAFGIDFQRGGGTGPDFVQGVAPVPSAPGTASLGLVGNNFQAVLNALITQNRARVVNSMRVTTFNNLTAQMVSRATFSFPLIKTNQTVTNGVVHTTTDVTETDTAASVTFTVTPTINRDGTVTLAVQSVFSAEESKPGDSAILVDKQEVNSIANIRDGDTLAIGGLRIKPVIGLKRRVPVLGDLPLSGRLFRSDRTENEPQLFIFVTARIVHRVENTPRAN